MKRTLSILTALFGLLFSSFSALAYDCKVDGIYYDLNKTDKTASVTRELYGNRYSGDVVIPESIITEGTSYSVTSIGESAFDGCSELTSVTIPNSVKLIAFRAFCGCTGLTSVTIPNSVTSIGDGAFYGCSGLTSVTFNAENCTDMGDSSILHVFGGCTNLTTLTIGDKVTIIPFHGHFFLNCSGLTSVVVDKNNVIYDSRDNCNAIIETSTNTLVGGCKSTIIPNSVISIGDEAFCDCSGLTSVTIPNSVTSIGEFAFARCSGLTSVTIPNSITSISQSSFVGCSGLTSVTIPNSVTFIGGGAFYCCSGLTSVTIPNSVTSIGEYAFRDCSGLTSVVIPNSVTFIGNTAFSGCSGLTSVVVDKNNVIYDSRYKCNAIVETFTNTLIVGCKNTIIPNCVTSIGKDAFYNCSGLTSVTIPNSVTSIGEGAFSYCSGLKSATIGNSVTSIGRDAFRCCSGLTSVTIPNSVTSIGGCAFYCCSGLTKLVSLAVEPPTCSYWTFEYVDKATCRLFVPKGSGNKYMRANQWNQFEHISVYDGVDDVSVDTQGAVYEVYNLQGVRVGSGMHEAEITTDNMPHGIYILVSPQGRKKLKI